MARNPPQKFDYRKLAAETVKILRGHRSQARINQKLGARLSNLAHKWEATKTRVDWNDFVKFMEIVDIKRLKLALTTSIGYDRNLRDSEKILRAGLAGLQINEVSKRTGISRFRLSRLLAEEVSLKLDEFLQLLHRLVGTLDEFMTALIGEAWNEHPLSDTQLKLASTIEPKLGLLVATLKIARPKSYSSQIDFLRDASGFSPSELSRLLKYGLDHGAIEFFNGQYKAVENYQLQLSKRSDVILFTGTWAKEITKKFEENSLTKDDKIGALVFSVDAKCIQQIEERIYKFYREVQVIVESNKSDGSEGVRILLTAFAKPGMF
jgi:hypothetical protein